MLAFVVAILSVVAGGIVGAFVVVVVVAVVAAVAAVSDVAVARC